MHIVFLLLPISIVNMVMDLKLLTPLSTISNFLTILGLLLVFFYLVEDDVNIDKDKLYKPTLDGIPIFIGTTLFALEAVGVVRLIYLSVFFIKHFACSFVRFYIIIIFTGIIVTNGKESSRFCFNFFTTAPTELLDNNKCFNKFSI